MILTNENYFSPEADKHYMSVSQFKSFAGTLGERGCEAQALAKLNGEYRKGTSTAFLVGSYVDAYFEGTLDKFKQENPSIFTQKGDLKADYKRAETMIARIERDELFSETLQGEKQRIFTADLFGVPWKCKLDVFREGDAIVDLKTTKSIREGIWVKDYGKMNFIEYYGYDIQAAVYQEIVYRETGIRYPFFIAAISKEDEPDIEIISFDQKKLNDMLYFVEANLPRVVAVKNKMTPPDACGKCNFCKSRKQLSWPVHYSEIMEG